MRILNIDCPACGALMRVDMQQKKLFCDYCGKVMLIDDEVRHVQFDNAYDAGYRFEQGRQRAKKEFGSFNTNTVIINNVSTNRNVSIFSSMGAFGNNKIIINSNSRKRRKKTVSLTSVILILLLIMCCCCGLKGCSSSSTQPASAASFVED